jgi:hypothetical protein
VLGITQHAAREQLNTDIPSILLRTSASKKTENHTEENRHNYKQATQSTRWMPWRFKPMKDAETGETFEGSCMQALILKYPNGATLPESCLETCI